MKRAAWLLLTLGFLGIGVADELKDPADAVKELQKFLPHKVYKDDKAKYVNDVKEFRDANNFVQIELVTNPVTYFEITNKLARETFKVVPAALDSKPCGLTMEVDKEGNKTFTLSDTNSKGGTTWDGKITIKVTKDGKFLSVKAKQKTTTKTDNSSSEDVKQVDFSDN